MNKRGFVMAEALIVSAVVLTTLVLIYTQFAKIKKNYGDSYFYDNINDIYALNRIANFLSEENNTQIINNLSSYLDITNCTLSNEQEYCELLIETSNIKYLLFTYNDNNYILEALNTNNPYDLKLTTYIKNLSSPDPEHQYMLIAEFNDGTYASIPYGESTIMLGSTWFDAIANDGITKNDILSITTQDYIHYNDTYNKVYDISINHNDKVRAYLIDTETTGKYNIVLAANNGVYAPPNSSELFKDFQYLDRLDLSNFDTSKVTNMNNMFYRIGHSSTSLNLNLGNKFDTSKVTNMNNMFTNAGYATNNLTIDISQFTFNMNPTVNNFFGTERQYATTFYVKDQAAVDYLNPAVISNVTVSIKP